MGGARCHQEDEELFSRQSGSSRLFIFCLLRSQSEEEIQNSTFTFIVSSFPTLILFPHNYYLLLFSPLTCTSSSSHSSPLHLILSPHYPTNIRAAQKYSISFALMRTCESFSPLNLELLQGFLPNAVLLHQQHHPDPPNP